jgi:hypothetical protein
LLRGEFWEVRFAGRSALLEDCRGLRYISLLIQGAQADTRPMHAKELTAIATGRPPGPIELEAKTSVLDEVARKQVFDRLAEIADERDRACAAGDLDKATALDAEHERLADELSRHAARGAFSHDGEKARKAVGKAISEAIARIGAHPALAPLAEHLACALHKGQWLSYDGRADWDIDFRPSLPLK